MTLKILGKDGRLLTEIQDYLRPDISYDEPIQLQDIVGFNSDNILHIMYITRISSNYVRGIYWSYYKYLKEVKFSGPGLIFTEDRKIEHIYYRSPSKRV